MDISYIMKAVGVSTLIAVPFLSAQAAPLTPDQALSRLKDSSSVSRIPGNPSSFVLAHTETADSNPMLYVFNRGSEGFIITSADDSMPALLGYSDSGAFDLSDASPELIWWLGQYAGEAAFYLENGVATMSAPLSSPSRADRVAIPELLKSNWDQGNPYNLYCPEDGRGRSVTGCVATAMAQVIRYHGYPSQGAGEHSYSWNGQNLSFDYANTTFDYANMLDDYDASATPEQQQAVASLMYACGVGVDMVYSSSESSAGDMYIPYALKNFFNYDEGTRLLKRSCFATEEWEDLVYSELADGRPVIYGGQAPDGGHQFVCDGYENGYFHINWGWSGMGNGYFLLSALDPGLQGIGGFAGGYNSEQAIVWGAKPSQGGGDPWYPIYATGGIQVTDVYPSSSQAMVAIAEGGIFNYSPEPVTLSFYLKVVSEAGVEYLPNNPLELQFLGADGLNVSGYNGIPVFYPSGLEAGEYKASLVFKTPEGNWQDVMFPLTLASYVNLSVGVDGSYVFSEGAPVEKAKIKVSEFAPQSTVISGVSTRFNLTVENVGDIEFSNVILLKTFEKGTDTQALAESRIMVSVAAGEVFNGYVDLTYTLADGEYDVIAYDPYGEKVSEVFPLTIGEVPVAVERIVLDLTNASLETDETLQLTATVLPEDASDKGLIWSSSDPEVANVDQTGLVTAFAPGTAVITVKSAADEDISASCQVTVNAKVIYVSSITLDHSDIEAVVGTVVSLVATVLPEDATDKTLVWSSSNEEVATVDAEGTVIVKNEGSAVITATAADGSGVKAECIVSGVSGIDAVMNGEVKADVYTLGGILLKANADSAYIASLAKGSYILKIGSVSHKIIK